MSAVLLTTGLRLDSGSHFRHPRTSALPVLIPLCISILQQQQQQRRRQSSLLTAAISNL